MAQTAKAKGSRRGNTRSPILFKNERVLVCRNTLNEIFVENVQDGVMMRIGPSRLGGLEFTTKARIEPITINGEIYWHVEPR